MARHGQSADRSKARFFADSREASADFAGVPQCPKDLNAVAKKKWREVIKLLSAMDIVTKADKDLIELYCLAYSRLKAAQAMLDKYGEILKSKAGGLYRSP
jgi:P27 family predicted phage terminase small subunit